jgi:type I restriction enzyme S subunit
MNARKNVATCTTVGDLCNFESGNGFRPQDWKTQGLPIIRIQNLNGSRSFNYFDGELDPTWIIEPGDLLFAWAGVKGVSFGPTIWNGPKGVLNQHIYRIRPKASVNKRWLYYALAEVTTEIERKAHGFKTSLVHVHKSDIIDARIALPGKAEQVAVATTLLCWDTAIEKTERLIAAKEQRKVVLLAELPNGKRRLHGHNTAWCNWHLGELFQERVETNRGDLPLLSITREEGVIRRDNLGRKDTSSEDKSKYQRICPGDIGYNTMRMWQGVSALSRYGGIVSPAYTICIPSPEIDGKFASYLFKLPALIHLFYRYSQGLTSDTWNLKFHHFAEIRVHIPKLDEQIAIASVLAVLDDELAILKKQQKALAQQKRGLMQKLLTGEWRVKSELTPEAAA